MPPELQYILSPELIRRSNREDRFDRRISNLIAPWDRVEEMDVALLMVPFARAAQRGDNGGANAPNAIRTAFTNNTSYSPDFDVDLKCLTIRDIGEVRLHMTDVLQSHRNIEEAVVELYQCIDVPILVSVGGDHSIACPLVQGYCRAHPDERLGIVHFDAHNDVRNFEDGGPTNGTPFRGIIEGPAAVEGKNLVQVGIHGFMNSSHYKKYCDEKGVTVITAREVRRRGIDAVMEDAIAIAADGTDAIYVSFDIDCLSHCFSPGTGNSSPEGMDAWDVVEAMFILGQHPSVRALDVVCIDPLRDVGDATARMGASTILTFLGGFVVRHTGGRGY
jgi:formiminoglutamase